MITSGLEGVYIVKKHGEFISHNHALAWIGFDKLGLLPRSFGVEEVIEGRLPLRREEVVVGGVGIVKEALRQLGVAAPDIDYPKELYPFLGRGVWRGTLVELRRRSEAEPPVFVKPVEEKRFVGMVVGQFRDLIATAHLPDDEAVYYSDAVEFVAEKRYFVLDGKICWLGHYSGDPLAQLDHQVVREAQRAYRSAPAAYSLDFGLTSDGRTLLVEVNDAFALGAYGTPPILYAQLIATRWKEILDIPS